MSHWCQIAKIHDWKLWRGNKRAELSSTSGESHRRTGLCRWPSQLNHGGSNWKWIGNAAFSSQRQIWCEYSLKAAWCWIHTLIFYQYLLQLLFHSSHCCPQQLEHDVIIQHWGLNFDSYKAVLSMHWILHEYYKKANSVTVTAVEHPGIFDKLGLNHLIGSEHHKVAWLLKGRYNVDKAPCSLTDRAPGKTSPSVACIRHRYGETCRVWCGAGLQKRRMATCKKSIYGFYHNTSKGILLKHQFGVLFVVLFYSSFSSVRPRTKNVKAPPTILTNKHTSEAEGSLAPSQDWGRTWQSGGDDRRNKPLWVTKVHSAVFQSGEVWNQRAIYRKKNERKRPLEKNLLAAFWSVRIQNETKRKWTQMHKHARK